MGVHGLWRLIDPSGKPVPLETLENKILAVDISIWLHQAIKGFQDSRGAPLPNAHLLGIYHRVCKLLYFKIKPVFVFDGGVPALKKQTIISRNQRKNKIQNDANSIQNKLLNTLLKHSAIKNVLGEPSKPLPTTKISNKKDKEDMFKLPEMEGQDLDTTAESTCSYSTSETDEASPTKQWDLQTIDEKSSHFKSLPADIRHEILTDLKETRKQSSWGRLHELPTESGEFSGFQMKRLLKRYSVQVSLEEAQKEMGGHSLSLGELESLLTDEGVLIASRGASGRIASNENLRYLYIKDVKKEIERIRVEQAKKTLEDIEEETKEAEAEETVKESITEADKEFQRDLAAAIQLSLQGEPSTSKEPTSSQENTYMDNFKDGDFASSESDEETSLKMFEQAKGYMMEYSGLTPVEILKIIKGKGANAKTKKKSTKTEVNNANVSDKNICSADIDLQNEDAKHKSNPATEISSDSEFEEVEDAKPIEVATKNNFITSVEDSKTSDIKNNSITSDSEFKEHTKSLETASELVESSSDDDFQEVEMVEAKPKLEIIIDPKNQIEDDLFSDIFAETKVLAASKEEEETIIVKEDKSKDDEPIVVEDKPQVVKEIVEPKKEMVEPPKEIVEPSKEIVETTKEIVETAKDVVEIEETEELLPVVKESVLLNEIVEQMQNVSDAAGTVAQLSDLSSQLDREQRQLVTERNTKERMAGNITDQMYKEAQELLELFGLPYVVAPMEAEAQCAFLDDINLTDGTITDDSDIWLFGGKTVYKNFFNQNKQVMEFRSESIQHYFKLTREQMILLALLVGSDYTIGIQGIGPVTALEILSSFPPATDKDLTQNEVITGLIEFRRWLTEGRGPGRTTLRKKLQNITISDGFPSVSVVRAYLQPEVDDCRETFTWGKPDIVSLIDFAREKFGWSRLKSEEILKPVLKRMEETTIQKSIKEYFKTKHKVQGGIEDAKVSKRVKTAVENFGKVDEVEEKKKVKRPGRKRERKQQDLAEREIDKQSGSSQTTLDSKKTAETDESAVKPKKIGRRRAEFIRRKELERLSDLAKQEEEIKQSGSTIRVQRPSRNLHSDKNIPQRERDKASALKTKIKAIEIFRKSKQGPGYVKKRPKVTQHLKEHAELSEDSSE